jgi:hypothetical protein
MARKLRNVPLRRQGEAVKNQNYRIVLVNARISASMLGQGAIKSLGH